MFVQAHRLHGAGSTLLAFMASTAVQAFPCGRRGTISGNQMPFDPEARLNTEANNIKQTSANGLAQTYLSSWSDNTLSLVLAGYLFNINIAEMNDYNTFSGKLLECLSNKDSTLNPETVDSIYVNIRLEETPLYTDGITDYYTSILRDQAYEDASSGVTLNTKKARLDLLKDGIDVSGTQPSDYYFSGLSFSTRAITSSASQEEFTNRAYSIEKLVSNNVTQRVISLKILKKVDGNWQIFEPARLPEIRHGETPGSVEFGSLNATSLKQDGVSVATMNLVTENGKPHLQFTFTTN
jgi:hypothetical protein